jgi:hypothetical protein
MFFLHGKRKEEENAAAFTESKYKDRHKQAAFKNLESLFNKIDELRLSYSSGNLIDNFPVFE